MNDTPPIASLEGLRTSIEEAGKRIKANPDHPASKELIKILRALQKALEPIGTTPLPPTPGVRGPSV
jgi:hypothetical protein